MFVANFFDELAAHFLRGRLDESITVAHFGSISAHYYKKFSWFVEEFQRRDPTAFKEWQQVNDVIRDARGSRKDAMDYARRLWRDAL